MTTTGPTRKRPVGPRTRQVGKSAQKDKRAKYDSDEDLFVGWSDCLDDGDVIEAVLEVSETQVKRLLRDPEGWICNAIRKQRKELSMRDLEAMSDEDRALFDEAKSVEISEFLRESAVSGIHDATDIPRERLMGMRWLLTWKPIEGGGRKAKARIVIQGYQDPDLTSVSTQSPTASKLAKLLTLQFAAQSKWKIELADAHAAFLQGSESETKRKVFCFAVPELAAALGVSESRMVQIHKACYGLANAPREWWISVNERFAKAGLHKLRSDGCVSIGRDDNGDVCTIITAHVDDFLIVGGKNGKAHEAFRQKILASFRWSPWKENSFTMTGVEVKQMADGSILVLSQSTWTSLMRL